MIIKEKHTEIKLKRNNSQYHLNLNLTKYVHYINRFELKVISVESGAMKFNKNLRIAFPHSYLKILKFHNIIRDFHFI